MHNCVHASQVRRCGLHVRHANFGTNVSENLHGFSMFWKDSRNSDKCHQNQAKIAKVASKIFFWNIQFWTSKTFGRFFWNVEVWTVQKYVKTHKCKYFQRVFACKNRRRYSRERASQGLEESSIHSSVASLRGPLRRRPLSAAGPSRAPSLFPTHLPNLFTTYDPSFLTSLVNPQDL